MPTCSFHLSAGRAPAAADEVVLDAATADRGDLNVGDTTLVRAPQPIEVTIVGLTKFGDLDGGRRRDVRGVHHPGSAAVSVGFERPGVLGRSARRPGVAGGVALTIAATSSPDGALMRAGLAAIFLVVGAVVLGPVVARPTAAVLGAPLSMMRGQTGRLARRNAMRNPLRTAGSASALMVGTAVVVLFAAFGSSIKPSINDAVDRTFGGDLVIVQDNFSGVAIDPAVDPAVAALPEVDATAALANVVMTVHGADTFLTAVQPSKLNAVLDLDVLSGDLAGMTDGRMAVSRHYVTDEGLADIRCSGLDVDRHRQRCRSRRHRGSRRRHHHGAGAHRPRSAPLGKFRRGGRRSIGDPRFVPPLFGSEWCDVRYTIEVPRDIDVQVSADNDGVSISNVDGAVELHSDNGSIRATDLTGNVQMSSDNGGVRGTGLAGDSVTANSDNGSVNIEMIEAPRTVQATSDNGSVTIVVPQGDETYVGGHQYRQRTSRQPVAHRFHQRSSRDGAK